MRFSIIAAQRSRSSGNLGLVGPSEALIIAAQRSRSSGNMAMWMAARLPIIAAQRSRSSGNYVDHNGGGTES